MADIQGLFGVISGGKVLDVATGQGGFVQFLSEHLGNYVEIIGIDTQESGSVAFLRSFPDNPRIRFIKMDARHLDFEDATFDSVCIANSLHHMPDLAQVLAEMMRVLKPGGRLIALEMYRDGQTETQLTHVLLHHWWAAVDSAFGISHRETYTRQQIVDILQNLGLAEMIWADEGNLDDDPLDPQGIEQLDAIIDRYKARAEGLPGQAQLQRTGEELRQRVHSVGFHGATSLVMIGRKANSDG